MSVATMSSSSTNASRQNADMVARVNNPAVQQRLFTAFQQVLAERLTHRSDGGNRIHRMRPRMCLKENVATNQMIAVFELPGMRQTDIHVSANGGELTVFGERLPPPVADGQERMHFDELKYGSLQRVVKIPGVDPTQIEASFAEDGMLTVKWPIPPRPVKQEEDGATSAQ